MAAFSIKLLAAGAICFYYHKKMPLDRDKADVFKYYDESKYLTEKISEPVLYLKMMFSSECDDCKVQYEKMRHWYKPKQYGFANDSRTMIKLHSVFALISGGFYLPQIVLFSFVSFLGLVLILKGLYLFQPRSHLESLVFLSVLPSILIWTSAPLKECLFSLLIGASFFFYAAWLKKNRGTLWILLPVIAFSYFLKPQIGLLLFLCMFFLALAPLLLGKFKKYYFIGFGGFILLFLMFNPRVFEVLNFKKQQYDLEARGQAHVETDNAIFLISLDKLDDPMLHQELNLNVKGQVYWYKSDKENWITMKEDSTVKGKIIWLNQPAGSHIQMKEYDHFFSWLKIIPTALINVFIKPDPNSFFSSLFFLENLVLIFIVFLGIYKGDSSFQLIYLWGFGIALALLYGTTVPVIGALLRYKSLVYLSFIIAIFAGNRKALIPFFRRYD